MPHTQTNKSTGKTQSQVTRRSQMNKADMSRSTPASRPRDDLRTAYGGDENRGPAGDPKSKAAKGGKVKGKRLSSTSGKTPIR